MYRSASLLVLFAISSAASSWLTPNSFAMFLIAFTIALKASAFPIFRPGTQSLQMPSANSFNELEDMGEGEVEVRVEVEVEEEVEVVSTTAWTVVASAVGTGPLE